MRQADIIDAQDMSDGISLAPSWEIAEGTLIGTCACGCDVLVPMEDTHGIVSCDGCGSAWRLSLFPKVERA